jgi:hypothetical protein
VSGAPPAAADASHPAPVHSCSSGPRRNGLAAIEDRIFTERHLRLAGVGAAEVWVLIVGWLFFLTGWLARPGAKWSCIDFGWIWLTGRFAVSSDPSRVYDDAAFAAAALARFGAHGCLLFRGLDYPPVLLFFTYPLGLLPYFWAFALWNAVTLILYLTAVGLIVRHWTAIIMALTPFAVPASIALGHNGLFTAALIGLALYDVERRPWRAGLALGMLTYKPQFGLLFPLALVASRNWRALFGAAGSSAILGGAATLAFGLRTWPSFVTSLFGRNGSLSPGAGVELRLQSIYGMAHWLGAGTWTAWAAHLTAAAVVASAVAAVWAWPIRYRLKASLLCAGSVTVSPYVLPYDLSILSIAAAFLVSDGLANGFLPGERAALSICWAGLLLLPVAPIGAIIAIALLLLICQRITVALRLGVSTTSDPRNGRPGREIPSKPRAACATGDENIPPGRTPTRSLTLAASPIKGEAKISAEPGSTSPSMGEVGAHGSARSAARGQAPRREGVKQEPTT